MSIAGPPPKLYPAVAGWVLVAGMMGTKSSCTDTMSCKWIAITGKSYDAFSNEKNSWVNQQT